MQAKLPKFLKFKSSSDLIRLGKDFDGGYLASETDVLKSDALISLGINDDWSFEEDFLKKNNVKVFAYDASMSKKHFFNLFKRSFRNLNFKFAKHWFKTWLNYKKFFSKNNVTHVEKFVGLSCNNQTYCTLSSIFENLKQEKIFVKIDIEGWEYRLLDDLLKYQNKITALVIEFHDFDIHLDRIENFIKKFDLKLAHVHANNTVPIRTKDQLSIVMELTFSRFSDFTNETYLPHQFDMPTTSKVEEVTLTVDD